LNRRKDDLDVLVKPLSDSGESDMTGINVKMASPSAGLGTDELKNKKVCDFEYDYDYFLRNNTG